MTQSLFDWELRDWPNREHSRFVNRGGIRWHVQTMGRGPVLLLVHGTGASTHSFRELMPQLAEHFTVVAPDLPGHAYSIASPLFDPSLPAMAAALEELLEALALEPTIAVGHSAGAAIVLRMALERPRRASLLVGLAAALVPLRGVARALFPPAARLLARSSVASSLIAFRARDRGSVDRMLQSTGSTLDARGVELYARLSKRPAHVAAVMAMMASWDLEPLFAELPRLDVPMLLIAGEGDRAVPLRQQRFAAARMRQARVVVVSGAGHLVHEEEPRAVAHAIIDEALAREGKPA